MWTQKPSTTTKPPTFLQFFDLSAWFLMLSVVCYYLMWMRNNISIQLAVTWNHTFSIEQGKLCAWLDCWQVEPEKAHNGRSQQGSSSRRVLVIARDVWLQGVLGSCQHMLNISMRWFIDIHCEGTWRYLEVTQMQHREASPLRAQDQIMEVQGEKEHKQMLKLLKQEPDTWLKTPLDWPQGCG